MHQHRTRIDELLDIELLQSAQQVTRTFNVYASIQRVVSVGKIKIGHQMKHTGQAASKLLAHPVQRQFDGIR